MLIGCIYNSYSKSPSYKSPDVKQVKVRIYKCDEPKVKIKMKSGSEDSTSSKIKIWMKVTVKFLH